MWLKWLQALVIPRAQQLFFSRQTEIWLISGAIAFGNP